MGRVIVVGSVNVDLVVAVGRLPRPGETVTGGTFERFQGGKGGNQAVAAARLGADVHVVAAVGDDEHGEAAISALARGGASIGLVHRTATAPTGVALIVVDDAGENLIAVAGGANDELDPARVTAALQALSPMAGDVVLVTCEIPASSIAAALSRARSAGARALLNPAPVDRVSRDALGFAHVVTPNEAELARLTGQAGEPTDGALAMLAVHPAIEAVLVSLGARGAVLVTRASRPIAIPAPSVAAVDTTGAGDALNGALAAGLAAGLDLETAARRAVLASSISVTKAGARGGLPTLAELEAWSGLA